MCNPSTMHWMCCYLKMFSVSGGCRFFSYSCWRQCNLFCVYLNVPVKVESTLVRGSLKDGENWFVRAMTLVACAARSCVQIMYLFYSVALLHKYFTSLFIYSHICCLIHTCIFYLYISVDYLQGRSASTPGEIPVPPFFSRPVMYVFIFVPFLHPLLAKEGLPVLCLGTKFAICMDSYFLVELAAHHFCHCSRFV